MVMYASLSSASQLAIRPSSSLTSPVRARTVCSLRWNEVIGRRIDDRRIKAMIRGRVLCCSYFMSASPMWAGSGPRQL